MRAARPPRVESLYDEAWDNGFGAGAAAGLAYAALLILGLLMALAG
jgi:hypothetical protein